MSQYRLGTVSVTNGDPSVTVTGASAGAENVAVGDSFKVDRDGDAIYQLASRTPSSGATLTSLTLSVNYGGTTGSGLNYQITQDYTPNRSYPELAQGDQDAADWLTRALRLIDQDMALLLSGSVLRGAAPALKTGTSYTVGATDGALIINGSATYTLTLPDPTTVTGRLLMVKTIAAFAVNSASSNVKPLDSDTAGTAILAATAGKWATLASDGATWIIMAGN